jgi:hypothetical protein
VIIELVERNIESPDTLMATLAHPFPKRPRSARDADHTNPLEVMARRAIPMDPNVPPFSDDVVLPQNDPNERAVPADGSRLSKIAQADGAAAGATVFRFAFAAVFFRLRYASRRLRLMTLLYCRPISVFTSLRCFDSVCATMIIRRARFNIYLLGLALLVPVTGCQSPESARAKQIATFRLHLAVTPDGTHFSEPVPIYRANPTMVNIDRSAFLTEGSIAGARVISDELGGYSLQVQFDPRGTYLLEQYTAMYPGKRFAIFGEFGEKMEQHRWLGAPIIPRRISNGILTFTPDATREEAEQIAIGLNNVAIQSGNQEKPKKTKPESK